MPFAIVQISQYSTLTASQIQSLERVCKEVWASMDENPKYQEGGPYRAEDIGGVGIANSIGAGVLLTFIYNNRGSEFLHDLRYAFHKKLEQLKLHGLQFKAVPTEPDLWFANPSWATAPCTKPHMSEDNIPIYHRLK